MDLRGAVCMVTGAASGIGAALVDELEELGAGVVAVDVRSCRSSSTRTDRIVIQADVASPGELRAAFDRVARGPGRLDVLFNNAGVLGEPWPDQTPESIARLAAVNLGGVMVGTRLALEAMRGAGGVVVNTASKTGLFEHADAAAYAATKAGIIHFTRCCASLAVTHGVRVNAVLPGMTATSLFDRSLAPGRATSPPPGDLLDPGAVARILVDVAADDAMEPGTFRLADRDAVERDRAGSRSGDSA